MPDNKSQHYVPKYTLRRWASDFETSDKPKQINLINIARQKVVYNAKLKSQCCGDYFYSRNIIIEHAIGGLEGLFSSLTRDIIDREGFGLKDEWHLGMMVVFQRSRTQSMESASNDMFDKAAKLMLFGRVDEGELREIKIEIKNAAIMNVVTAVNLSPIVLDLKKSLIINKSNIPFIVSDNPVVQSNFFCRARFPDRGGFGLSKAGLQIVMPLDPKHAVMLHDPGVYAVDSRQGVIHLHDQRDVEILNDLQWYNALKNVYFSPGTPVSETDRLLGVARTRGGEFSFSRLESKGEKEVYRATSKNEYDGPSEGVDSELIHFAAKPLEKDIRLKCLKIRNRPKYYDNGSMASPKRDPAWSDLCSDFADAALDQRASLERFWDFAEAHWLFGRVGLWLSRNERRYVSQFK